MGLLIEGKEMQGVKDGRCHYCMNEEKELFHQFYHHGFEKEVSYCRSCIRMTYSSTETFYDLLELPPVYEEADYQLDFELTDQQQYASRAIVETVIEGGRKLLHAVTGAGKTEMILEGIKVARQRGQNVALVSPRVDVVKELYLRMNEYFRTDIDVLYQGQTLQFNSTFVISTVQQLVKYQNHFGLVIVDEVDAFPLPMDKRLRQTLERAATKDAALVYLTATPSKELQREMKEVTVVLPARYHRRPLPVPSYKYLSKRQLMKGGLSPYLKRQPATYLLVFFNNISDMAQAADVYRDFQPVTVYAADALRHEKVEAIRAGQHAIIFTTTILERGFTMANLDVYVIGAESYTAECLVQMAGRVDRKFIPYEGTVRFFHDGVSREMQAAVQEIRKMNIDAKKRGWID
ncbi:DEAD/DEAH box helicase family protein [Macrococcus bovicus]|uniref:DEAD/DEAH box helicase n=1 Tax=Macrococcus bovicus TaxID=69968 RepID=A0A4R6C0V2_9STAP|nr:DEAD/DEAH box helicase family protein [Macrococcus bovicus]TDM14686.1 DEAD/DEAH box helicase [Macrococcus bovicus]